MANFDLFTNYYKDNTKESSLCRFDPYNVQFEGLKNEILNGEATNEIPSSETIYSCIKNRFNRIQTFSISTPIDEKFQADQSDDVDLNLLDKSKFMLILSDELKSFKSLLESNSDCTYFPLYKLNKKMVSYEPVSTEIIQKRKIRNSSKILAHFDLYSKWDDKYTSDYFKIDSNLEKESQPSEIIQRKSFISKLLKSKSYSDKTVNDLSINIEPPEPAILETQPECDVNLLDNSRFMLVFTKIESASFNDTMQVNPDCAYFPLYRFNQKLVKFEPVSSEIIQKRNLKNSASILANFDLFSEWDRGYTNDYLDKKSDLSMVMFEDPYSANFEQLSSIQKKEIDKNADVSNKSNLTVFNHISNFINEKNSKLKFSEPYEEPNIDLNLLDKSQFSLLFEDLDNNSYKSIVQENNECAYFPLYKFNKQLVKYEELPNEILQKRKIKNSTNILANFDQYTEWDKSYTKDYAKTDSTMLENIPELRTHQTASFFSKLFKKSSTNLVFVQKSTDTIESVEQQAESADINVLDKSEYILMLKKAENTTYFSVLETNTDCAYFPIYKINKKAAYFEQVSDETIRKRKVKNTPSNLANFDLYTEWDSSYTSNYTAQKEDKILERPINICTLLNLFKGKNVSISSQKHEFTETPKYEELTVDVNILDKSKFNLSHKALDQHAFKKVLEENENCAYFPLYKFNKKLITYEPVSNEILQKRQLKNSPNVLANFDLYQEWNAAYTNGYYKKKSSLIEFDPYSTPEQNVEKDMYKSAEQSKSSISLFSFTKSNRGLENTELENVHLEDNDKDDINVLDKSKYVLILNNLENESYKNVLTHNQDCAYFPKYKINKKLIKYEAVAAEVLQKRQVKNSSSIPANFDLYSEWDMAYTNDYVKKYSNLAKFDPYSEQLDNDKKYSSSSLKSILASFFPRKQRTTDFLEDSQSQVDINLLDHSKFTFAFTNLNDYSFNNVLDKNKDCTYFPLFKLNKSVVNYEPISNETIFKRQIKNSPSNSAHFDLYAEWDSNYTLNYLKTIKKFNIETFNMNPLAEVEHVKHEIIEETKSENQQNRMTMFSYLAKFFGTSKSTKVSTINDEQIVPTCNTSLGSSFPRNAESSSLKTETCLSEKQTDLNLEPTLPNFSFDLNRLIEKLRIKDFDQINELFQETFYRAPLSLNRDLGISLNSFANLPSSPPGFNSQFNYFDMLRFQNLKKNKPYANDFATYPSFQYEYSQYYLLLNSSRFDFINQVQRTGKPFFFVHEYHNLLENVDRSLNAKNILGFIFISFGAASLLSFTFINPKI